MATKLDKTIKRELENGRTAVHGRHLPCRDQNHPEGLPQRSRDDLEVAVGRRAGGRDGLKCGNSGIPVEYVGHQ